MLRSLSVRRLATIDAIDVEFAPGLTVLTGETGAGKSMLVEALGLLVGERASPDLVRTGADAATVEAVFATPDGGELLVRRDVSSLGRSRAFLDGSPVTTAALRERVGGLVDLHGQHAHQELLDPVTHLDVIDAFGGLEALRAAVAAAHQRWRAALRALEEARAAATDREARLDLLAFQLQDIDRVAPRAGEDEELAAAHRVLAHADRLARLASEAYAALYDGDAAALATLAGVWRRLGELAAIDPRFAPFLEPRDTIRSQLEELAFFLRSYAAGLEASPDRLQAVDDRLAALERLKKRYGPTLADVLARREALERERERLEHVADTLAALECEATAARDRYAAAARELSSARRDTAGPFCRRLEAALAELAMPHTRCELRLAEEEAEEEWTARGLDRGELYLSPNPGEDLRPLARIASGGELSRIMLALKTLAATDAPGKTLVFDEIDAGIGGAVADVIGRRLQQLAERCQVLCITHLPQIAACGATHLRIRKSVTGGRTWTAVERIAGNDREEEVARLIAGSGAG
ncbi:MAG TPA: DNA repair protein RecN, partial [Vicinamibacterales bacterium]|nr:DNA repair protein RecN [Vicinamibacterales bacterium]